MRSPAIANAVTISGEPTKAKVFGFPSALFEKFLLKEWTIVFFSFFSDPSRFHWPMHGPQAFAKIFAPSFSKTSRYPSRSTVNLTCSEPGVTVKDDWALNPASFACFAIEAALEISSYEEFVQEPIKPTSIFFGQLFFFSIILHLWYRCS